MLRRLFRLLVVLSVVAILGVVAIWVATNTDIGRERVRRFVQGVLQGTTHGIVRIGAMHGDLLHGSTMVRVSITDSAGHPFFKADSITAGYVLRSFLANRIELSDAIVYRPVVMVQKLPGQEWNYRLLWPLTPSAGPADTLPGWGSWVRFHNARIVDGDITVGSPWSPRTGLSKAVRDSVVRDALSDGSRLKIIEVPGGYLKVVALEHLNAVMPFVRIAEPGYKNRMATVSGLQMLAFPFRPPAARITALAGKFEFNDDSLWWKGAKVNMPASSMRGDGVYNISNGDMRLTLGASPATFNDFKWLYDRFPSTGGGNLGLTVQWRGATQDYVMRDADLKWNGAHLTGDAGVTVADTVFYHDANVRFSGLTTKMIHDLDPTQNWPRQGVLSGRAKFAGTFKRMTLDADVTFAAYDRGTSRIVANGVAGWTGTKKVVVNASNLHLRLLPLQMDIVKIIFPTLPVNGVLTGVATLNGIGSSQLYATGLDIVHQDGPNRTHAVGRANVHTTGRQTLDLDVVTNPLALAELTKFAPSLPLKGLASGPIHAHGPIDALGVDTRLSLPGGGTLAVRGTVDFLSKELGYDVVADATALDLSRVMIGMPRTALTGGGTARGRGFKPATQVADLDFSFRPSVFDTIAVDSAAVKARLANGIATVNRAFVRASGARVEAAGTIGLDARHSGSLAYDFAIDSLAAFAHFLPGLGPDTGIVKPRPRLTAERLKRAKEDSARVDKATEVARAISGVKLKKVQVDTPSAIPRNILAGSVRAAGTIAGSVSRFTLAGTATGAGLVVRGNSAKHLSATYRWADARTARSKMTVALAGDTISAFGFSFDSLAGALDYLKPNGTLAVRIRQGNARDYSLNGDFTLDKARNELRLADVALHFDTTTWKSTHPSAVRWGTRGIEVVNLELRSGGTRRIYANGLLPTAGRANFDLAVTDFAVENIAELLQSDIPLTGRVTLDAHVQGTAVAPEAAGKLDLVHARYNGTTVPDVHGTFSYANKQLTTNAGVFDSTGRTLARLDGTVPIDLALSGVTGSRLLDLPISATLVSDSIPVGLIPQFTDVVSDVRGGVKVNASVKGTLKRPELLGRLSLREAHFKLNATGAVFDHVNGDVRMTGDSVFVDSIVAIANGPVRVGGTLGIGNWREPSFNLSLTASDAALLDNERGTLHADAGLRISGPFNKAYVSGQVTIIHGVFYLPESSGKKLVGAGDPALFSVIDTSMASQRELFPAQSPLFENLRVDVDLSVERNTWVRSRDANVELFTDGPLRVSVAGDALTLVGAVDADRGEYTFLSKRFQIKRGSALFIGTPDLNPTLQVTAEYEVKQPTGTTNIRVLIGGTLEKPRISLESDAQPPLSQSDLLSYLAFGESSGSLLQFNQTSLSANRAGNLVAAYGGIVLGEALNEIKGNAARSLGFDVFNITPGGFTFSNGQTGFDQFLRGTEVEAGKYISPTTFVSGVITPGSFACRRGTSTNSACAPPGFTLVHRTNKGYRLETSYTPRYFLDPPTLQGQTATGGGQFGAFLIREWRF